MAPVLRHEGILFELMANDDRSCRQVQDATPKPKPGILHLSSLMCRPFHATCLQEGTSTMRWQSRQMSYNVRRCGPCVFLLRLQSVACFDAGAQSLRLGSHILIDSGLAGQSLSHDQRGLSHGVSRRRTRENNGANCMMTCRIV